MEKKLQNLLQPQRNEYAELKKLCRETQKQIDDAVEQGNEALLDLQNDFEKLAEKKRELLRDIEALNEKYTKLEKKVGYVENTYGKYLKEIKEGIKNEPEV